MRALYTVSTRDPSGHIELYANQSRADAERIVLAHARDHGRTAHTTYAAYKEELVSTLTAIRDATQFGWIITPANEAQFVLPQEALIRGAVR